MKGKGKIRGGRSFGLGNNAYCIVFLSAQTPPTQRKRPKREKINEGENGQKCGLGWRGITWSGADAHRLTETRGKRHP